MEYPQLEKVIQVIKKLRDPVNGCPWDLEQTHESLLKYLIEESYEYTYAVEQKNQKNMQDELGDVLLQVLLHSQIASESSHFDIEDVAKNLAEKMIRRHPHVFKDKALARDSKEVAQNWDEIKKKEKKNNYFINIEDAYAPSLKAADIIGAKSKKINFDWDNVEDVIKKVDEELNETKIEIKRNDQEKMKEEIGDLLFSVAQLARHLDIDAEEALKEANLKFVKRINLVENKIKADGKTMIEMPTKELEDYWQKVKLELKNSNI